MSEPDGSGTLTHSGKAKVIRQYAREHGLDLFVETGTYRGDMVAEVLHDFRKIFSIELGLEHCLHARERFREDRHVNIAWGDSGNALGSILVMFGGPALIYLDAHCSGEDTYCNGGMTPVMKEFEAISRLYEAGVLDERSVILVDDAKDFTPENGHPHLKDFLRKVISSLPNHDISCSYNIIRITPKLEK